MWSFRDLAEEIRWRRRQIGVLALLAVGVAAAVWCVARPGEAFEVSASGGAPYRTIREALIAARPGSRILIHPGAYRENLDISMSVSLIGVGARDQIIIESSDTHTIRILQGEAVLRGLTIRCAAPKVGSDGFAAVRVITGQPLIEDCDITALSDASLWVSSAMSKPRVRNCRIRDGGAWGFGAEENARGTVEDCDIFGNAEANVYLTTGADTVFRRCHIRNGRKNGLVVDDHGKGLFEDCDFHANFWPNIYIENGGEPTVRGCRIFEGTRPGVFITLQGLGTFEDCEVHHLREAGFKVDQMSRPTVRNCQIHDCLYGLSFDTYAFGTVEDCDIHDVYECGIYSQLSANPTVRRCRIHDTRGGGVLFCRGPMAPGPIAGIVEDCEIFNVGYPGIGIQSGANPQIRNCRVHGATATSGIFVYGGGRGTIEECEVYENFKSGIAIKSEATPVIRGCRLHDNGQYGVHASEGGNGTVENCELRGNGLGAIQVEPGCNLTQSGNRTL